MEANELRIGNLINKFGVDYDSMEEPIVDRHDVEVVSVNIDVLKNIEDYNYTTDYDYYEPIPLTKEWLLKFGGVSSILNFGLYGDNERGFHYAADYSGEWIFVSYVHQLQNLYFTLTGEELEIK